jgi:hypothetical protein
MSTNKKIILGIIFIPIFIFTLLTSVLIIKKDSLVKRIINDLSESYVGDFQFEEVSISPFENFPYISLDLKNFTFFEDKDSSKPPLMQVDDLYIGFDFWTIASGDFQVKYTKLSKGYLTIVQDENDELNLLKAIASLEEKEEDLSNDDAISLSLESIQLTDIELRKINTKDSLELFFDIKSAQSKLGFKENSVDVFVDTELFFSIISRADTTFVNHKYMEFHTGFTYDLDKDFLNFTSAEVVVETGVFDMQGNINLVEDALMDLQFSGKSNNFDLFFALAPNEVGDVLKAYENKGNVFFEASIKGKSAGGNSPLVEAKFGCENGFFDNLVNDKQLSDLNFLGFFTNGAEQHMRTSEVRIQNFSAKPEAGIFNGNLRITNFVSPEIDVQLDSDFDLNFLTGFFNLDDLRNLTGKVQLQMNFNDIIDLENPERALEEFNQSYYTKLVIDNLNFQSDSFHLPIKNLSVKATAEGNLTEIELFKFNLGESDFYFKGSLTNLPDIIHKTNNKVEANLLFKSDFVNLTQITASENIEDVIDEELRDFTARFKFNGNANTFQVSKSLPLGEFYIEEFNASLKNYPHQLHDFFASIYIEEKQLKVNDFKGMIDDSDIHFTGCLKNYPILFEENSSGILDFTFQLDSNQLSFRDIFSYKNENYIPEDYRDEELSQLRSNGSIKLTFNDSLVAADLNLGEFKGKMKIHPLKFENFKGNLHFEDEQLGFEDFQGKIGKSKFKVSGNYYLGKNEAKLKAGDRLIFKALHLDLDELTNYKEPAPTEEVNHDDVFNIFEVPFRNMKIEASIGKLNYHKYLLTNFSSSMRMQDDHYMYIDQMSFEAANGKVGLEGYFNGSNPDSIYFHTDLKMKEVDVDQLLFKFDNFGQDQLISDNLHGIMTGRIRGEMLMHTDLTPYVEKSELTIDVSMKNGRLENFEPLHAMAEFFDDKNLNKVFFGSLENRLELKDGSIIIPNMVINSSLGFMQLSGKQSVDMEMDYYLRIPLQMVTQVASRKLFGSRSKVIDPTQEDEIIYKDETRNTRYVNIRMRGNPEGYNISLRKNRNENKGASGFDKTDDFLFDGIEINNFSW